MPKIPLGYAVGIVPPLAHIIDKLAKKNPTFTYQVKSTHKNSNKEQWVDCVSVLDGCDIVGEISFGLYNGKENKNGDKPDAFGIHSDNVKKQRGERGTIITADPAAALRHALKVFKKPNAYAIAASINERTRQFINGQGYTWRYLLREAYNLSDAEAASMFIEAQIYNRPLTLPKTFSLQEGGAAKYETYLASKQIVEIFDRTAPSGFVVQHMEDDSYRVVNLMAFKSVSSTLVTDEQRTSRVDEYYKHYREFEEMPKFMQERVAVLKISQETEPIYNFGVRFGGTNAWFFYIFEEGFCDEHPSSKYASVQSE